MIEDSPYTEKEVTGILDLFEKYAFDLENKEEADADANDE